MKVLVITYCFVPLQFPATFRLLKWLRYLSESNHDITIVSVDPASFDGKTDPTLQELVPRQVDHIQVPSWEKSLSFQLLRKRERWFYRYFQPHKKEWFWPARRHLSALPLGDYDVVFSCSQPPVAHLLGQYVRQVTRIPWVTYFSDPWVDLRFADASQQRIKHYNLALERAVIEEADRVIFSSAETKDLVLSKYSRDVCAKAEVLDHCFVPDWYQLRHVRLPAEGNATNVVLTGSFYGPRSVIPFLEILNECNWQNDYFGRVLFNFYGRMSEADRHHPIWNVVQPIARFRGEVEFLDSLAIMRQAEYLLLIDAPVAGNQRSVFFPSKLADYLGAGRPIIGLTPRQGTTSRILKELGHQVVDWSDRAGLQSVVDTIAQKPKCSNGTPFNVSKYDYRQVGRRLEQVLQSALGLTPMTSAAVGSHG